MKEQNDLSYVFYLFYSYTSIYSCSTHSYLELLEAKQKFLHQMVDQSLMTLKTSSADELLLLPYHNQSCQVYLPMQAGIQEEPDILQLIWLLYYPILIRKIRICQFKLMTGMANKLID